MINEPRYVSDDELALIIEDPLNWGPGLVRRAAIELRVRRASAPVAKARGQLTNEQRVALLMVQKRVETMGDVLKELQSETLSLLSVVDFSSDPLQLGRSRS